MSALRILLFLALSLLPALIAGPAASQTNDDASTGKTEAKNSAILIGVAAPLSGSNALLGAQVVAGARAAAGAQGDPSVELAKQDTQCSAEGGMSAAHALVRRKVAVVVGFLCTDAIEAALPVLKEAGIPTLDVGVRANRLTDRRHRTGDLVWRIAPRSDAIAGKIADAIADRWRDQPFGLVDDGSIAARGLSDAVRRLLGDQGLEPQIVDNYRPAEEKQFGLARRLQRSGVTRFFIAGDRPDVATIIRDAKELGLSLQVIGGDTLFDEATPDLPLASGTLAVGQLTRFPQLATSSIVADDSAAVMDARGPQGYAGPAYAATQIAIQAARQASGNSTAIATFLDDATFDTGLGPIQFDEKGDSTLDLFDVFRWDGDRFVPQTDG